RRELPWRAEPRDPYRVWVSEVMLQQTRVDVVIPYYLRFLRRFPTIFDLAAAGEDEVLALWSGLGYYARARNLHRAACAAAARGGLPRAAAGLRELPGFGAYTAAAVASRRRFRRRKERASGRCSSGRLPRSTARTAPFCCASAATASCSPAYGTSPPLRSWAARSAKRSVARPRCAGSSDRRSWSPKA